MLYMYRDLTTMQAEHCLQERTTNYQKHCRVKPNLFFDLLISFEHAHMFKTCLFVTEETCQVCPAPASVRKRYEGAYGVNPMPVGHSEAAMTGIFTRL